MPKIKTYTRHQVMLDKSAVSEAWVCGNGNISAGFRFLAEFHRKAVARKVDDDRVQHEREGWELCDVENKVVGIHG